MEYLLSYAWKNWRDGTASNLIDPTLMKGSPMAEMMRCIHIGLLCVQQNVVDRPDMASVVLMLNSDLVALPVPTQPAGFMQSNVHLREKRVVAALTQGPMCEDEIVGVIPHRLLKGLMVNL
ncbi:cysteine-rich receptor-like protein kinase 44 [Corylus avellana]|uniref:cysteine-rich receptor-like protein kinase 44 n=1 Tax=Corylus avellana TaxID=13451 RepID=UPI00286B00A7|nr:cysteine-rich receptor-like protein kinase 44 [Corylus avellana]